MLMGYRSTARCSLLRPTPFLGSSAWSHNPCVIDVSATIDTDGAALPPARCDISTFADISIFVCPSIALSSSANRSPIEAPPTLTHGDFATFHLPAQLLADLSFPFYFLGSICRLRPELLQNVLMQIWRVGFFGPFFYF